MIKEAYEGSFVSEVTTLAWTQELVSPTFFCSYEDVVVEVPPVLRPRSGGNCKREPVSEEVVYGLGVVRVPVWQFAVGEESSMMEG